MTIKWSQTLSIGLTGFGWLVLLSLEASFGPPWLTGLVLVLAGRNLFLPLAYSLAILVGWLLAWFYVLPAGYLASAAVISLAIGKWSYFQQVFSWRRLLIQSLVLPLLVVSLMPQWHWSRSVISLTVSLGLFILFIYWLKRRK
jgi:hypothetical protein